MVERSAPIRQVLLKVHSRCNLSCDYCYVYEHVDQSWRRQPFTMSRDTATLAAMRIAEHAHRHDLDRVTVVLHGGEPLMAGVDLINHAVSQIRSAVPARTKLDVHVQTNGLLLDERFLTLFDRLGVRVGVSLDGDRAANDRHRRFAHGGSSYAGVAAAIDLLRIPAFSHLYSGLLSTVDIENDPIEVYEGLLTFAPPRIDLLLPHGNWTTPPPHRHPGGTDTPYADWLIAVFDRWYGAPQRETRIRLFEAIMSLLAGGRSTSEMVGLERIDLLVVETDGSLEQGDALKTTTEGMAATGLTLATHSFDEALRHPGIQARQQGLDALAPECRRCPAVAVCGGGLYAHRYRADNGFANPTVYCPDQLKLIGHVRDRMAADVRGLRERSAPALSTPVRYRLTGGQFDDLAAGYGDPAAMAVLRSVESSRVRLLLAAIVEHVDDRDGAGELLTRITRQHRNVADEVLAHPFVSAWATRCLRRLRSDQPQGAELDYLGALAGAAAMRAGLDFKLTVSTRNGQLALPTVGLAYGLGSGPATLVGTGAELVIEGSADTVTVPAPFTVDSIFWCARRELTADSPAGLLTVTVEDLDPYRTCFGLRAADRLPPAAFRRMAKLFAEAWELIGAHHPRQAAAMRVVLRSLVPLVAPPAGSISAAAKNAFGSIAVSLPADGARLALLMIHEVQHVKLSGLLNFIDLYASKERQMHHAPWRADPRPLGALLQGTYAHVGVTDYWRTRRRFSHGTDARTAHFEFAYWLEQTRRAADTLLRSGELTSDGERFVTRLGATLDAWVAEPFDSDLLADVSDLVEAVAMRWRLANFAAPQADATRLASAWRVGQPCPPAGRPETVPAPAGKPAEAAGLAERLRTRWTAAAGVTHPAAGAEAAYLAGDFATALVGYRDAVAASPEDDEAWAGLALTLAKTGEPAAARVLTDRPDLVRALVAELRRGSVPDAATPDQVAAWMSGAYGGVVRSVAAPSRS